MDAAIDQKDHKEMRKCRHGISKHIESSVKLRISDEVEDPPSWKYE
jgi:hypothetical protein